MAGIRRADAVILTRCEQAADDRLEAVRSRVRDLAGDVPILRARHRVCGGVDGRRTRWGAGPRVLDGARVFAFAGIAQPRAFFATVESAGATLAGTRAFRDHHDFSAADLREIREQAAAAGAQYLVCTVKDLVKIDAAMLQTAGIEPDHLRAVEIEIDLDENEREMLKSKLAEVCRRVPRTSP